MLFFLFICLFFCMWSLPVRILSYWFYHKRMFENENISSLYLLVGLFFFKKYLQVDALSEVCMQWCDAFFDSIYFSIIRLRFCFLKCRCTYKRKWFLLWNFLSYVVVFYNMHYQNICSCKIVFANLSFYSTVSPFI